MECKDASLSYVQKIHTFIGILLTISVIMMDHDESLGNKALTPDKVPLAPPRKPRVGIQRITYGLEQRGPISLLLYSVSFHLLQ